jgi:thiol-disulfide isomerase/thioredoxin
VLKRRWLNKRALGVALVGQAAVLLLSACSGSGSTTSSTGYVSGDGSITVVAPADRKPAPKLAGVDLHGKPLSASDLGGSVLVVNVWGSWCAPCRREAPVLAAAARRYENRGVRFLGLLSRDKPAAALAFNRTFRIPYPSLQDPGGRLQLRFSDSLPGQAVPNTWVIDSRGRVAARIMAELSASTLRDVLDEVGVKQ